MKIKHFAVAKKDESAPFVVGGAYAHRFTDMILVLMRVKDGQEGERYAFFDPQEGYVGPVRDRDDVEALLAVYDYLPDAYLAIPKEA